MPGQKAIVKAKFKKTIAIDFDGVIHKYSKGYLDGSLYDEPVKGVAEALYELGYKKGYNIVIFTARDSFDEIREWIDEKVWKGGEQGCIVEITNKKPPAIAYIDDRGIRFTNWKDILNYF